jgi:anthranilate phosphoribosyltransferase
MDTKYILNKLISKQSLTRAEARSLMQSIVEGEVTPVQSAAILTALRIKRETIEEITGFVQALREKAVMVRPRTSGVIDTCGTGGDQCHTFNISTATAIVAAAMGVPVAKHGNRAVSSKCGSTDVLEALGINLDLEPEHVATLIDEVGVGFLFAPAHHPAMKNVAEVRRELGVRTVFNILGPMANPAGVKRQLIGVFADELTEVMAKVLHQLGSEKVFVVHGRDGLDEVSISGPTVVSMLEQGHVHTMTFVPEDAGLERSAVSELGGGSAEANAAHIRDILRGKKGPRRDAIVLNAAFVAVLADKTKHLHEGAELAQDTIRSGKALEMLETLREASHSLGKRAAGGE